MAQQTVVNEKNFNAQLSGMLTSAKNMREKVQALIVFGLQHYKEHEDSTYLTKVIQAAVGVRALPTTTIKDYIKDHANLKYVKLKDGKLGFKKEAKGVDPDIKMPDVVWWMWDGGKHNADTADKDAFEVFQRFLKRLESGKGIKDGPHLDKLKGALAKVAAEVLPAEQPKAQEH